MESVELLVIALWLIFGLLAASIAQRKTGDPFFGFLLGLFFGPLGMLVAALRRPRAKEEERMNARAGLRKCPHCAEWVKPEAVVCRYCQRDLSPA